MITLGEGIYLLWQRKGLGLMRMGKGKLTPSIHLRTAEQTAPDAPTLAHAQGSPASLQDPITHQYLRGAMMNQHQPGWRF